MIPLQQRWMKSETMAPFSLVQLPERLRKAAIEVTGRDRECRK